MTATIRAVQVDGIVVAGHKVHAVQRELVQLAEDVAREATGRPPTEREWRAMVNELLIGAEDAGSQSAGPPTR